MSPGSHLVSLPCTSGANLISAEGNAFVRQIWTSVHLVPMPPQEGKDVPSVQFLFLDRGRSSVGED
jgi:hypothetical protein